jgi:hypothetical protein
MSGNTPEAAIRDYLTQPEIVVSPAPQPGATGWRGQVARGGYGARPETLQFGKSRALGERLVYAVTFTSGAGIAMRYVCHLRRERAGEGVDDWRFIGGAGGGADGDPLRGQPWVNLCGSYGREFYAGGRALEHGGAVARVRLAGAKGYALEDAPDEDEMVLFLADDPPLPLQVELLDSAGQVIARGAPLG